jgi:hypothetical protein
MKKGLARVWMAAFPALAVTVVACGGVAEAPVVHPPATSGALTASVKSWEQCLRSHGVPVPSGYAVSGHVPPGGKGPLPAQAKPNAPAAVQAACAAYLPPMSAPLQQAWLNFAKCMRDHGIPAPNPSFAPNGGEMEMVYPKGVGPSEAGFSAAQTVCMRVSGLG